MRQISKGLIVVRKYMVLIDEFEGPETLRAYQVNVSVSRHGEIGLSAGVDDQPYIYTHVDEYTRNDEPITEELIVEIARGFLKKWLKDHGR